MLGLGFAIVLILLFGAFMGFLVIQARFAARKWRQVIAAGDQSALDQLLDMTFEAWRESRPPRGTPPADWRALHSAALIAADRDRCRVSLVADADERVVDGERVEVRTVLDVARHSAVRMVERLVYEVPHVRFQQVQVDVLDQYRDASGARTTRCLLTTRVTREAASFADWAAPAEAILAEWDTREASAGAPADPDAEPVIVPAEIAAVREAERALRATPEQSEGDA